MAIEQLRKTGLTQSALAARVGLSKTYLSTLLNTPSRTPSLRVAIAIEDATDGLIPARWWIERGETEREEAGA